MYESEQGQGLLAQFHLQRGTAQHINQQRIAELFTQIRISSHTRHRRKQVCLTGRHARGQEPLFSGAAQQRSILAKRTPFCRKVFSQHPGKLIESLRKHKVPDRYPVETEVKAFPRQIKQPEVTKRSVKRLTFAKPSHIVESCVVPHSPAAIALHAASCLRPFLEHKHTQPAPRENGGALQAAQTASDNYHIILHSSCFRNPFFHRSTAMLPRYSI